MPQSFPSWVNGSIQSTLSVLDRAIAYGDGVFETIRTQPNNVLLDYHIDRLAKGLATLQIPLDLDQIKSDFSKYQTEFSPGLIKIIVSRGVGGRGYLAPETPEPMVIIQGFDLPAYPSCFAVSGEDVYLCSTPMTVNPVLKGIKHLNRLEQVMARKEFSNTDYFEGLMLNTSGQIIEGTMSNLFVVKNGVTETAGLDHCAVNGTMQRYIIEKCTDIVGPVVQHQGFSEADLLSADEVFICNSVYGILSIKSLMGKPINVSDTGVVHSLQEKVLPLFS